MSIQSIQSIAAPLTALAAETHSGGTHLNHWAVGAAVLAVLVLAVLGLLAFGAGREHS